MARTETYIQAPPEAVFEVLRDPSSYGGWVVGSSEIRGVEGPWPAKGSLFHHRVGWGPLKVSDYTRVEEVDPPHRLKLRAKARPLGTAMVTLELRPEGTGTRVAMIEAPAAPLTALVFNPLTHLLVRGRNEESLNRLKVLAEREAARPGGDAGARRALASP